MTRIDELDGLRTIAILLVIGHHYDAFANALYGIPKVGWVGVDIFFVLSGFLITSILLELRRKPHPFIVFYTRRTLRIFPPYFLVLVLVFGAAAVMRPEKWHLIVGMFASDAIFFESLRKTWQVSSQIISDLRVHSLPTFNLHTILPFWSPRPAEHLEFSLGPVWSLSVEEWFYILWAPLVLKLERNRIVGAGILAIVLCCLFRFLGFDGRSWYFAFFCRTDTLIVGGLLSLWAERRRLKPWTRVPGDNVISVLAGISTLLLTFLLLCISPIVGREIRESLAFATFGPIIIAVIVAAGLNWVLNVASTQSLISRLLRLPLMIFIGKRSYMLYLIHEPGYCLVDRFSRIVSGHQPGFVRWLVAVLSLVVSISITSISWRFFENPILQAKEQWTSLIVRRLRIPATAALKSA